MADTLTEINENTKMARETALFGQYDTSLVYYQGVIQQIQKYLSSIKDPDRRRKWMQVLNSIIYSPNSISVNYLKLIRKCYRGDWFWYCCFYLLYRPETWYYQSAIKWKKFVTHWQASRVTLDHPHTTLMTTKKLVHLLATTLEMIILVTKNQPGTQMFGHPQPQWSIGKPSEFQKSCKILQLDCWFEYQFLFYLKRIRCTGFYIKVLGVLLIRIYLTYFITRKKNHLSFFCFLLTLKNLYGLFCRPGPNYRGGVRQPARKPEPARNRAAPSRAGPGDRRGPSQPSGRGRQPGPGQKDNKKKVCVK